MDKLALLFIGLFLLVALTNFQTTGVGRSGTWFMYDSLGTTPPSQFRYGKFLRWYKLGGDGLIHPYRTNGAGTTVREDSTTGGTGTSKRVSPYAWYNWSAVADSQIIFESDTTFTIDSIRVIQAGASAVSVNFKRIRSGTPVDLLSANYAVTTSMTTASGIQNNSILRNDQIWAVIRSITGTSTYIFMQVCYH